MGYSPAAKNLMLDYLDNVALYASLHSADPGETGANELSGGSPAYARKLVGWGTPAAGVTSLNNQPIFDVPAGFVLYVGYWSAASGGTFYGGGLLSPALAEFTSQGLVKLTSGQMDLNALGASVPEGAVTAALSAMTAAAEGLLVPVAAVASTLPVTTGQAEGLLIPVAEGTASLVAPTASADGNVGDSITATAAATIVAMTSAATGLLVPVATTAASLSAMTASGAGVQTDVGTGAASLSALTASAAGAYGEETNYVGNPGFESTLAGTLGYDNWKADTWYESQSFTINPVVVAERIASGVMAGSYVGRMAATGGSYDLYDEELDEWYSVDSVAQAYLKQHIRGDDFRASSGTLSFSVRFLTGSIGDGRNVCVVVFAYDSGNNNITDYNTASKYVLNVYGNSVGNQSAALSSPSVNTNYTFSKSGFKDYVVAGLASGKTINDIAYVLIQLTVESQGASYGTSEAYADTAALT